jgi:predicted dehydrogenase
MIRVGLVGFGLAGRVFHAPLIASVEGLELAAVVERSTNNAAERYPGITTYRSIEEMLADASLGLIVLGTPSGAHFEQAKQILSAGKNLVVDKPVAATAAEIAQLDDLAKKSGVLLAPFHNRRWDSDFQTIQKLIHEGSLGRLVSFESNFDRWRPVAKAGAWREDPAQAGGTLLDLGTHLADQALVLFGKPEGVTAEVKRERDGEGSNDFFLIHLRYPGLTATLGANCLSAPTRPRYHLRGIKANWVKLGLDPQEAALSQIAKIADPKWGQEPADRWGVLHVDVDGGMVTRPVSTIPGDYRLYYAGIRDTLLGKQTAPVTAADAWRTAKVLEWAVQSSAERREILCDWSGEQVSQ